MRSTSHLVRLGAVAVACVGLALTASACSKKLDPTSSADSIKTQVNTALAGSPITISTVTCPNDIEAKQGVSFTCQVKLSDGKTVDVKATQVDSNGQFTIDPSAIATAIAGSAAAGAGITPPTT